MTMPAQHHKLMPHLVELRLQGFEAEVQGIPHGSHIKHLVYVLFVGSLQFFPKPSWEGVHHRHKEEAVELELYCLDYMIPYACIGELRWGRLIKAKACRVPSNVDLTGQQNICLFCMQQELYHGRAASEIHVPAQRAVVMVLHFHMIHYMLKLWAFLWAGMRSPIKA